MSGIVTAEAGRLGTPPLIAIGDGTGGIVLKLPDGTSPPARGARVEVRGPLADPYGQLEIRPPAGGLRVVGSGALPSPVTADATTLGEGLEGQLVVIHGIVDKKPTKATSGDITFYLRGVAGTIRVVADASSRLTVDSIAAGADYEIVGITGQRATRKGALDGYRVWPRDAGDVHRVASPGGSVPPSPGATGTPAPSPSGSSDPAGSLSTIAEAVRRGEGHVAVEGVVTTAADLLDSTGRRIVIEDRTAGVEVLLPADTRPPAVGSRVRIEGTMARAYDAPRLKADHVTILAVGARPLPLDLRAAPSAALEWRLVRVTGTVAEVHKLGDRWRAELVVGGGRVVVNGLTGARIPSTALAVGRSATVLGIVRRPYPGATDRRWSIVPRGVADVALGAASGGGGAGGGSGGNGDDPGHPSAGPGASGPGSTAPTAPDVDLVDLAEHVGQVVRVGGLVTELLPDGFMLDDGTAVGRIVLTGGAAEYLPLLEQDDALNAVGTIEADGGGFRIVVSDPAGLVRVGDPVLDALGGAASAAPDSPIDVDEPASRMAGGFLGAGGPGALGVLGVSLISLASLAVTLLRRLRARRLLAARVAARVADLAGPPGA